MGPHLSDEQLLLLIRGGDADAFGELWSRYAPAVLSVALRLLGERPAAEDATQDAFASVWRMAASFDPARGAAASWLYAVARNAARDVARRRRVVPVPDDMAEQADPGPGPDEQAAAELDAFEVHRALAALSPRSREVIELAYFGGLSQSEIAARTQIPLGTVKTRTRNALLQLAETLAPIGGLP